MEVIPNDSEKGPIDIWLDGFEFPDLPKGADEVYKVKGNSTYLKTVYFPVKLQQICHSVTKYAHRDLCGNQAQR